MIEEIYERKIKSSRKSNLFIIARKSKFLKCSKNKSLKTSAETENNKKLTTRSESQCRKKSKIKWPKRNSSEWAHLDNYLTPLLRTLYAAPDVRTKTHPNVIYGMCKERFGVK